MITGTHVAALLYFCGWQPVEGASIARKPYDTAVGEKAALAYLRDFGDMDSDVMLQGDYQSEGRNCLESHAILIPRKCDEQTLRHLVRSFSSTVDEVVRQTYAVKLLTQ